MNKKDEAWAVFWCSLLHPILFGEIEPRDTNRYLKKLAKNEVCFPNGQLKRPSLSTLIDSVMSLALLLLLLI